MIDTRERFYAIQFLALSNVIYMYSVTKPFLTRSSYLVATNLAMAFVAFRGYTHYS